jgi:hypothetical protein
VKDKRTTYILVPLTIIIWGIIFIKIYSEFGSKKLIIENLSRVIHVEQANNKDSVYDLILNYPDPFLKEHGRNKQLSRSANMELKNSIPANTWPNIEFRGFVGKNSGTETGFLKIGNTNMLVMQGQNLSGFIIRSIVKDSICIEFKNELRWFPNLK